MDTKRYNLAHVIRRTLGKLAGKYSTETPADQAYLSPVPLPDLLQSLQLPVFAARL